MQIVFLVGHIPPPFFFFLSFCFYQSILLIDISRVTVVTLTKNSELFATLFDLSHLSMDDVVHE